jgi:hypothetical protein
MAKNVFRLKSTACEVFVTGVKTAIFARLNRARNAQSED